MNEFWKKTGTVLVAGLLGGVAGGGGALVFDKAPQIDQTDLSNIATAEDLENLGFQVTDLAEDVKTVQDKLLEDDMWEATAEVLALEELEDDDYEDLFDHLNSLNGIEIDDEDDIDKVVIRDTKTDGDATDEDAEVLMKLRVYYENSEGDDKKETVYAKVLIEDGEVEDLDFGDEFEFD